MNWRGRPLEMLKGQSRDSMVRQARAVQPTSVALLHSPLTGAAAWGRLPEVLREMGLLVVEPEVTDDEAPPYASRYIGRAAVQLSVELDGRESSSSTVLVAHSGAGPLLPALGFARRSARRPVSGYVFLDAGLPRPGRAASRLDLLDAEDSGFATLLRTHLASGGRFPDWSDDELAEDVADAADRALLMASLRSRTIEFFDEPLPTSADWPDAPCGYLQTSPAYEACARLARGRGWPVLETDAGHFAALSDPERTASRLLELFARM